MTFADNLTSPTNRPRVVTAVIEVIESEVAEKSGLSGMMLKGAFATVKGLGQGFVEKAVDAMVPDMAAALEPYWESKGDRPFGVHLSAHSAEVSDAILKVADDMAGKVDNPTAVKVYKSFRAKGREHVVASLPRLGAALEQFRV